MRASQTSPAVRRCVGVFTLAVVIYSAFIVADYRPIHASPQVEQLAEETWKTSAKLADTNERVARNETTVQQLQVKLDTLSERASEMKATVDLNNKLMIAVISSSIIMLLERAIAIKSRKREEED